MSSRVESINPYAGDGLCEAKHVQVRRMFNSIAPAYDVMNRLMSLGMDRSWRRATVNAAAAAHPGHILDIATGTGDLAMELARKCPDAHVTGVDLSEGMVEVGRRKVEAAGLSGRVTLGTADALALPFPDNSFDVITVAFGVRNFERLEQGYTEMKRVLRPGGSLMVLELSTPGSAVVRPAYDIYTRGVIPLIGRVVSGDKSAYTYLPRSIAAVPVRNEMCELIAAAGLEAARWKSFTFGVCTLYTARKPQSLPNT